MLDGVVRRGLGHATQSLGEAIMWHGVILFMCISSTPDDAPEPQRLEPVGVQGREVDDRISPHRDADERGAGSIDPEALRIVVGDPSASRF